MRTLPFLLLAATPALACGPGSGSFVDNLPFLVFFLLMNPVTWAVLTFMVVVGVVLNAPLKERPRSPSVRSTR